MKKIHAKWDHLNEVLVNIWWMLERGAAQSTDPFHWPVLGTMSGEGCRLRTVILRQFEASNRLIVCHTDARSPKVKEIIDSPQTSWLFYHPEKKIQISISGPATLHTDDSFADQQWTNTSLTNRLNFCASPPPSSPIDKPSSGIPHFLLKKIPSLLETEKYRKNFMAIAVQIQSIDWLILKITGNRRARFEWKKDQWAASWIVP